MRVYMLVYFAPRLREHHATVGTEKPVLFPGCVEDFTLEMEWDGKSDFNSLNEQAKTKATERGFIIQGL